MRELKKKALDEQSTSIIKEKIIAFDEAAITGK